MGFLSETNVKAVRKRHLCDGCGQEINIGEPATRWAGHADGDFATAIYHPDCREAEVALNRENEWRDGDDWWLLSDANRDEVEWIAETWPNVAKRLRPTTQGEKTNG